MNKRIQKLQKILQEQQLDWALYATSGNMQYFLDDDSYAWQRTPFTGFVINDGTGDQVAVPDCVLCIPGQGEPVLILTPIRNRDKMCIRDRPCSMKSTPSISYPSPPGPVWR